MLACKAGRIDIVQLLLDHGADINATNANGDNALAIARESGNTDIVNLLETYQQALAGV